MYRVHLPASPPSPPWRPSAWCWGPRRSGWCSSRLRQDVLVHGPGGVGKSRLVCDAAYELVTEGAADTVYCGTPHLPTSDDWYVGVLPEARALVILDEPTDAHFVVRFLAELRSRTKQWKVLVAVRTPRDPVIDALRDPRERLLAPPLELKPLPEDDAVRYAIALLAPLPLADEQRHLAGKWLVSVCGRFPIWMTVAVRLLEQRSDLRALPKDEFGIAREYVQEIVAHTRREVADDAQMVALLRWVALAQPVNRAAGGALESLADAAGFRGRAAVDRALEDLARRRVMTHFGIDRRMVEVRPDVLRDHC